MTRVAVGGFLGPLFGNNETQLSLLDQPPSLDQARTARDEGMRRAADHAEDAAPGWAHGAYEFLLAYARAHMYFISEDVSDASKVAGMDQPPTDRAWGAVYLKARKAGMILQDGCGRSRRRHASICPRWRSIVFIPPPRAA